MDAYDLHEARLIQNRNSGVSAANALIASIGPVPAHKVWTICAALAYCSVAETKSYWFAIRSQDGNYYPITHPQDAVIDPVTQKWFPMLTEGMEIKLYPGESLSVLRASNTVGSTIAIYTRLIESDLPYYQYRDPQKKVFASTQRHGSVFRSTGGISQSGSGGEGSAGSGFGGEGGGPSEPGA
jgi:uncharacterized membrane protein YgcG